jgi:UPF0755 protein
MKNEIVKKFKFYALVAEIVLVTSLFFIFYNFYLPLGTERTSIYTDGNLTRTFRTLRFVGYDINDLDMLAALLFLHSKKGWYEIRPNATYGRIGFFSDLFTHPSRTMRIRIYGGDGKDDILSRLAEDMKLPLSELQRAYADANLSEGDLLAGFYVVARDADAYALIDALSLMSRHRAEKVFADNGWSIPDIATRRILYTVASIIQKETHRKEEMPLIASVIYNRLAADMKLQMDGTLNYGPYSHVPVTPERIRTDATRYNTYRYKGLPPAPICSFSPDALQAALNPAATDYLYFILEQGAKHAFSEHYAEHIRKIRTIRKKALRRKTKR